jgi:hypothetical protein
LLVVASAVAAVVTYLVLMVPLQVSGSGYFLIGMVALIGAQVPLIRVGLRLSRPATLLEVATSVARARASHGIASAVGAIALVIAMVRLTQHTQLGALTVINTVLAFAVYLMIATLLGTDLILSRMMRGDAISIDAQASIQDSEQRLATLARESALSASAR